MADCGELTVKVPTVKSLFFTIVKKNHSVNKNAFVILMSVLTDDIFPPTIDDIPAGTISTRRPSSSHSPKVRQTSLFPQGFSGF